MLLFLVTGIYTIAFLITNDFMKWYLRAKMTKAKDIVVNLNPNGTMELYGLIRKDGIMWSKDGNIVQDYERLSEETKQELKATGWRFGSVRFIFLMDGELATLNKQGKPASLDMPLFNRLRNLDKERLNKRNKLLKHKARPLGVFTLIIIAAIALIAIFALQSYVLPYIRGMM